MDEENAFGIGFLDRLGSEAEPISLTEGPNTMDVLNSIKSNVSNILNARSGEALSSPDLGLIDFNDALLETMDLSLRVKLAIKGCLDKYEPRLCNIQIQNVTNSSSPLELCFQIQADVNSNALHEKVKISLLLGGDRKYRVY
ncbi:type VI secretion system baseplate subunit TssE [Marinomonas posidonica]|uniref:Type VI secretion system lysozyme-related protein n=1 Tax=Marinomonas posidonica (strain CECT 7376 / NCIMB 14433 / IVIA-Po-181) TaxID=491952 RepID=F6CWW2_MARPP|nr:type VI secretion system baseplate subunit TssE [Marinomonas posidonica]AEF55524.1 type VI secretion system lysozyme-related protein [Marinomonas posidonica IVIA-Po-181]